MRIGKQLFSVFIDFVFLIIIFSIIISFIFITSRILYPGGNKENTLVIRTEKLSRNFDNSLKRNDTVYDTLTKRKLGEIKDLGREYDGDQFSFIITIDAKFTPKSESLRTKSLWFRYYTEKDN